MDIRLENEKKKEYLRQYRDNVKRIKRIEVELAELRAMKMSISARMDGMPHSREQSDLSGYAAKLGQTEGELMQERCQRVKTYKDIAKRIKDMRSEVEQDILFYRYIAGMEWWEIAEKLEYSERQVHRIHGKALKNFKIPSQKEKMS